LDRKFLLKMTAKAQPLKAGSLTVDHKPLHVPDLEEAAKVIQEGISLNYDNVTVSVVDCPNLQDSLNIAAEGLGGRPRLLDVGGVPNLVPLVKREKLYDMSEFPQMCDMKTGEEDGAEKCLIIGAGAAPYTFLDRNAEMMINVAFGKGGEVQNQKTTIARTFDADNSQTLIHLPKEETKISLLGNLFLSEGKPGKVLRITAKKRTDSDNFVSCLRKTLVKGYPGQPVGLGGVFTVAKGEVKTHVMPDFSKVPLKTDEDVANWLKFYNMKAPFTALSFLLSEDPGLDIRLEHSHGFNLEAVEGGHYHTDTTPDTVEYLAYYNVAEYIYRIDQPKETHQVGRD